MDELKKLKRKADEAQRKYQYALLRNAAEGVVHQFEGYVGSEVNTIGKLEAILDGWNPDTGGQL